MPYVDGFLIPVPKKKLGVYKKMARLGARMWMKHGALEYRECIGDDLYPKWGMPFPKLLRLKPGETAIFSWIVYKSKSHRNSVNAKVMKDPLMNEAPKEMPFDMKKMCYGGFTVAVEA